MKTIENTQCPVCLIDLQEDPWEDNSPNEAIICVNCGTQFGYHDIIRASGDYAKTMDRYSELMKLYIVKIASKPEELKKFCNRVVSLTLVL